MNGPTVEAFPINEVARQLGVKPIRLREAVRRGRIEPKRSERVLNYYHHYISLEDARRYLKRMEDRRRSNVKAS